MTTLLRHKTHIPSVLTNFNDFEKAFHSPWQSLINDFFNDMEGIKSFACSTKGSYPKVDIVEEDAQFKIIAEVPGYNREDVKIKITSNEGTNILTISADKRETNKEEETKYIYKELKRSSFSRSWQLTDNIDISKIDAKFKNGELEIILLKKTPTELKYNESYIEIK